MIQLRTMLNVADNSGAKLVQCIKVLGGSGRKIAQVGDIIVVSVKEAEPRKSVHKKDVLRAVIVRQRKEFKRKDGTYLRFGDNAVVLVDNKEPKGGRIFGPIPRELKEKGFDRIISLAEEVVWTFYKHHSSRTTWSIWKGCKGRKGKEKGSSPCLPASGGMPLGVMFIPFI